MKFKGPLPLNVLRKMNPDDRPAGVAGMLPEQIQDKVCAKAEKELQNQIMGWLEIQGVFAGRQRMDKKSNIRVGWPDIVLCWPGFNRNVPVAIECKMPGEKQTAEQLEAQRRMEHDGWLYRVIYSLPQFIDLTHSLGSRDPSKQA